MKAFKKEWTEKDLDVMGWHDNAIYSIRYDDELFELVLDIDYIFEWIPKKEDYDFVVAPATLRFINVWDIRFDFVPSKRLTINEIRNENPILPKNHEFIKKEIEWDWNIDLFNGDITFKSVGFVQKLRKTPTIYNSQTILSQDREHLQKYINELDLEERKTSLII